MTPSPPSHPLRCQCGTCQVPFAAVQNGRLVIMSLHHGQKHVNTLSLEDIRRLMEKQGATV